MAWGRPVAVAPGPLIAVSCAGARFCVALDRRSDAYVYDGRGWTGPTPLAGPGAPVGADAPSVSCTSATFCMAAPAGGPDAVQWNGTSWSSPVAVSNHGIQGISCAGPSFCAAVDGEGYSFVFDGRQWSGTAGDWGGIAALSCVGPGFCVSVSGGISVFDGARWTAPDQLGTTSLFSGVSCASATFCMAVDTSGQALLYDGSWSAPRQVEPPPSTASLSAAAPTGVSCGAVGTCVFVDSAGNAGEVDGRWTARRSVDPGRALSAVSCVGTRFCMAVDSAGDAVAAG